MANVIPSLRVGILLFVALGAVGCATSPDTDAPSEEPFIETFPLWISNKPATVYAQTRFFHNTIPALARMPDGRRFLTWSASIGSAREGRIRGAFSEGGGRTWGEPIELMNNPYRDAGDPSMPWP